MLLCTAFFCSFRATASAIFYVIRAVACGANLQLTWNDKGGRGRSHKTQQPARPAVPGRELQDRAFASHMVQNNRQTTGRQAISLKAQVKGRNIDGNLVWPQGGKKDAPPKVDFAVPGYWINGARSGERCKHGLHLLVVGPHCRQVVWQPLDHLPLLYHFSVLAAIPLIGRGSDWTRAEKDATGTTRTTSHAHRKASRDNAH